MPCQYGEWAENNVVPIRIHSECLTGGRTISTVRLWFSVEERCKNIVANDAVFYSTCARKGPWYWAPAYKSLKLIVGKMKVMTRFELNETNLGFEQIYAITVSAKRC